MGILFLFFMGAFCLRPLLGFSYAIWKLFIAGIPYDLLSLFKSKSPPDGVLLRVFSDCDHPSLLLSF